MTTSAGVVRRAIHVITPGDHFSPSTGSAVPTVVDGLCRFAPPRAPRAAVVVAAGTYADRYDSADIIEYNEAGPLPLGLGRWERHVGAALGQLGFPRPAARRAYAPTVESDSRWPDAVILGHNAPQLMPLVDSRRHRAVLYAHNHLFRTYSKREIAKTLGGTAAIVCVSDSLAGQMSSRLPGHLLERIRVVRNGVDYDSFRRETPAERDGPLNVVFVGRMIRDKGADVLVEAVRRLGRTDVHLTLVGSSGFDAYAELDPFERSVRTAAGALKVPAVVSPFVPRAEVARLLQRADVTVVPSRWLDPCPLTVSEGMAAGCAVIGSRIGGIPEALGGAGILVEPGDPDDLASAIEALADDEALLKDVAAKCARHAREHDWAWASENLQSVLEETCR